MLYVVFFSIYIRSNTIYLIASVYKRNSTTSVKVYLDVKVECYDCVSGNLIGYSKENISMHGFSCLQLVLQGYLSQ